MILGTGTLVSDSSGLVFIGSKPVQHRSIHIHSILVSRCVWNCFTLVSCLESELMKIQDDVGLGVCRGRMTVLDDESVSVTVHVHDLIPTYFWFSCTCFKGAGSEFELV
ncbi:hypothetical protein M6B38_224485 [Iris pallida]|uniref:CST complex subunit CTC1 n=1 Tax=Iris pallida TaxID=29817 RepID=A0AAX6DVI6_IRIPA|nr:hypothetical protein M6B38_224485 [Iris pallida]